MLRTTLSLILVLTFIDAAAQIEPHRVVARIADDSITVERFNGSYVQHLMRTGRNDTPQERYGHLNDLIDTYLLAEEARGQGLEDAHYQEFIDLEIRKVVGGRFFEIAFVDSLPDPTEEAVSEAFRQSNEKVILRQLFFNHPAEAERAFHRLESGEDFLDLANEVFETADFDSSAGYLGEADYWNLDDAVAEAAYELDPGEYSTPIRSRFGWHIVRLEDRLRNPLLTQDEYEKRRRDIAFRVRARRFRMEGTRFVRSYMEGLKVDVDVPAMTTLRDIVLRELKPQDETQPPRMVLDTEEVAAIADEFTPETVLATFEIDGARESFRAADYFKWMPHLPYGEVRSRPAASVGRALRNHVLATQGLALGLHRDPSVRDEVEYRASQYLAAELRSKLRAEADVEPTDAELREGFERLGLARLGKAEADFWHVTFDSFRAAETAKNDVVDGTASPESFETFARHHNADLTSMGELGVYIRKAPPGSPVVMGTGDGGWHLVFIEDRSIENVTFEDARDEVEQKLAPFIPEVRLLRKLRAQARVEIDAELFEEMMRLRSARSAPIQTERSEPSAPVQTEESAAHSSDTAPADDAAEPNDAPSLRTDRSLRSDTHPESH